jgi:hypothetical protein
MKRLPSWFNEFLLVVGIAANIVGLATAPHGVWIYAALVAGFIIYYLWRRIAEASGRKRASMQPPLLNPTSFSPWASHISQELSEDQKRVRDVLGLAAYTLLRWEQLDNGIWAKSYFSILSTHGDKIPLSGGTLSGSYFAAYSIYCALQGSCPESFATLLATINRLRSLDGTYRRLRRVITGGAEQFEPEPPRHAAAALLMRLLLTSPDDVDAKTVQWLCEQPAPTTALDAALVARALRAWSLHSPHTLHRVAPLLEALLPQQGQLASDYWRSNLAYVNNTTYQWYVVWTLLPFLKDAAIPRQIADGLTAAIRGMVNYFLILSPESNTLLPSGFDSNQQPHGESVLGTSVALIASVVCGWDGERDILIKKLLSRRYNLVSLPIKKLLSRGYNLVSLPTIQRQEACDIEVYIACGDPTKSDLP